MNVKLINPKAKNFIDTLEKVQCGLKETIDKDITISECQLSILDEEADKTIMLIDYDKPNEDDDGYFYVTQRMAKNKVRTKCGFGRAHLVFSINSFGYIDAAEGDNNIISEYKTVDVLCIHTPDDKVYPIIDFTITYNTKKNDISIHFDCLSISNEEMKGIKDSTLV